MKKDKDILLAYGIAICVSMFFLFVYGNSSFIKTKLDYLCLIFGLLLPFGLPVGIMIKKRIEGYNMNHKINIKGSG